MGLLERTRKPERRAELEAELAGVPIPAPLQYLWVWFTRLRNRRTSNGFGSNPITWQDIIFFQQLTGVHFSAWEVQMIEDLDNLDRNEQARSSNARTTTTQDKT